MENRLIKIEVSDDHKFLVINISKEGLKNIPLPRRLLVVFLLVIMVAVALPIALLIRLVFLVKDTFQWIKQIVIIVTEATNRSPE